MYTANNEQNHFIKEFKSKTTPWYDSNLQKVKEDILNSKVALLKERQMVFKAFESWIFSKLKQPE